MGFFLELLKNYSGVISSLFSTVVIEYSWAQKSSVGHHKNLPQCELRFALYLLLGTLNEGQHKFHYPSHLHFPTLFPTLEWIYIVLAYDHHGVLYLKCDTWFWTQIWCKFITGVLRDTVINSVLFLSVKWRLFLSFLLLLSGQKCFSLHLQLILHWRIFQILFFLSFPNDIFSLEHSLNTHIFFSSTFLWPRIQNARVGTACRPWIVDCTPFTSS